MCFVVGHHYIWLERDKAMKFGFINDENGLKLKEMFKNNIKLKEIHIDIFPENPLITSSNPFMLLLRTIEKNIIVRNDSNRLILEKVVNGVMVHYINVLFSEITMCFYKDSGDYFEFILNIQNTYYKITIYN